MTDSPSPIKSFKQAVQDGKTDTQLARRVAETELMLRDHKRMLLEHKQKLKTLDQRAERADRQARELSLVLYNLPYGDDDAYHKLFSVDRPLPIEYFQLGKSSPDQTRPPPMRLKFDTLDDKHLFLKDTSGLRKPTSGGMTTLPRLNRRRDRSLLRTFEHSILKVMIHFIEDLH